jgi:hypothetical protein
MSAPRMALLPQQSHTSSDSLSRLGRWLESLTHRCASAECTHSGKLWSAWLHAASAVEFEGRWYCGLPCLKSSVTFRIHTLLASFRQEKPRAFRLPLGLLLINRGYLSKGQLRSALQQQREFGRGRIGEWLLQLGMVTEEQLTQALGQQWACPVFPLDLQPPKASWGDLLPVPLLESACAVPVHASPDGRLVHLAFADRVDHTLLYAVEQMLGCRTVACVSSASAIAHFLEHLRRTAPREEASFDTVRDPRDMAATISNYAEELQATRISLARAAAYLWVRFHRNRSSRDLLFRVLPEPPFTFSDRLCGLPKAFPVSADKGKDGVSYAPNHYELIR